MVTQNAQPIRGNWSSESGIAIDSEALWGEHKCLDFSIEATRPYYKTLRETRLFCVGSRAVWSYQLLPLITTIQFHSAVSGASVELPQLSERHSVPCEIVLEPTELAQLLDDPANPYSEYLYLEVIFSSSEGTVNRNLKIEPGKTHTMEEMFE
jgi:hypothetical protein